MKTTRFVLLVLALVLPLCGEEPPPVKWAFDTGTEDTSRIQPTVGPDGTVYTASYAINPDGTRKWNFLSGGRSAIGIDGTIYLASGSLYALTPDKKVKWAFPPDSTDGAPAIGSDGTIYHVSTDHYLYALNPDGTQRWKAYVGVTRSIPAIGADGTIYVGTYLGVYAFESTGLMRWQRHEYGEVHSGFAIGANGNVHFGASPPGGFPRLYALKSDGSKDWEYVVADLASVPQISIPAIDSSNRIYFCTIRGIYCLDPGGSLAWKVSLGFVPSSPAICADGTIVALGYSLYGFSPNGSIKWTFECDNRGASAAGPTIAPNGDIIFSTHNKVYALAGGVPPANSAWPMFQKSALHTGRFDLGVDGPPVFSLQPLSQTVILNSTIYLRTGVAGTPPISFQWHKDGDPVPGATNQVLGLRGIQLSDAGRYVLSARNTLGEAESSTAIITVEPAIEMNLYSGITVQGQAGASCDILYAYDLSNTNNWTSLTNFTLPTATYLWIDPTPATLQRRYYRAVVTP